jgi:hypothetical protein
MAPECTLREHQYAIPRNFEHSATPLHQLDGSVWICLPYLGCQTGGPGLVVSNDAVTNRDVHVAERMGGGERNVAYPRSKVRRRPSLIAALHGGICTPARFAS